MHVQGIYKIIVIVLLVGQGGHTKVWYGPIGLGLGQTGHGETACMCTTVLCIHKVSTLYVYIHIYHITESCISTYTDWWSSHHVPVIAWPSLTRKIIISVNEVVPWVKTNGDTKSCYTYVQIGKNLQLIHYIYVYTTTLNHAYPRTQTGEAHTMY